MSLGQDEVAAIVIPVLVFSAIIALHLHYYINGTYTRSHHSSLYFFMKMREGWVNQNHLSGQAAANTTRDYIRVIIFLAGNAILVASVLAGFAVNIPPDNFRNRLLIIKLGSCVAVFIVIFICLLLCIRFILHFSFLMNVKEIDGKKVTKQVMYALFHGGHAYYSIALRLYFVIIPLFAWIFSEWCLFVFGPLYIFLSVRTEDASWLEKEVEEQFSSHDVASPTTTATSMAAMLPSNTFTASGLGSSIDSKGLKYDPVINQLHIENPV